MTFTPKDVTGALSLLDRYAEWKEIRATPGKLAALEKRIAELEARLERAPGEACKHCGKLARRLEKIVPTANVFLQASESRDYHWKCEDCGFPEVETKTALA